MQNEDILGMNKYITKHKLVGKKPPFDFKIDSTGEVWITQMEIDEPRKTDTMTIKIPEFVKGISLGEYINKTPRGHTFGIDRTIHGEFDTIIIDGGNIPLKGNLNWMFNQLDAKRIVFKDFDAREMTSMIGTFTFSRAQEIDFSGLKTEEMKYMNQTFQDCKSIQQIDLRNLNLDKLEELENTFQFCNVLEQIKLPILKGKKLKNISFMCQLDIKLTSVDANCLLSDNLIKMRGAFEACSSLKFLDLRGLNTKIGVDARRILNHTKQLEVICLSESVSVQETTIKDIQESLKNCERLQGIVVEDTLIQESTLSNMLVRLEEYSKNKGETKNN